MSGLRLLLAVGLSVVASSGAWSQDAVGAGGPPLLARAQGADAERPGALLLELDRQVLADLRAGRLDELSIPLLGEPVHFRRTAFHPRPTASTWVGEESATGGQLLLTLGADHLFGRVVHGEDAFQLVATGEPFVISVSRVDPSRAAPSPDCRARPPEEGAAPAAEPAAVRDDGSQVDVMILYTNGFAAYHGSQTMTRVQELVDLANLSFANSQVNTQLRLVYSAEVTYPDYTPGPGGLNEALFALQGNSGVFAGVETLRTTCGADQVVLLRRYLEFEEGCGTGYLLTAPNPRYAYAVVHEGTLPDGSGWYCEDYTYGHELGHNLGCNHDRANAGGYVGWFPYSYGYALAGHFRTVMAYGSQTQVAHFSNPGVSYLGHPTGVPIGDPNAADNASTVNFTRVVTAGYRASVQLDEVFADGFETGNVSRWSGVSP